MRRSHLIAPALSVALITSALAPRPLRRLSRLGVVAYLLAVAATAAGASRQPQQRREGALLMGVLPVMHFGWGFGTLVGMLRFGAPTAAFARLLGRGDTVAEADGDAELVHAPSLHGADA
jgi:hypothetical protein